MTDKCSIPDLPEIQKLRSEALSLQGMAELRHAPEELWTYLSNTEILFKKIGFGKQKIDRLFDSIKGNALYIETERDSEITDSKETFIELPFEWVAPEYLFCERFYLTGAFQYYALKLKAELSQTGGTLLTIEVRYLPRDENFSAMVFANEDIERLIAELKRIDEAIRRTEVLGYESFMAEEKTFGAEIDSLAKTWKHLAPDTALPEKISEYIYTAPDRYIRRMRPIPLSYFSRSTPSEVLRFLIKASREGYLKKNWDIICPVCKSQVQRYERLAEIPTQHHCSVCKTEFTPEFDKNIEITFSPNIKYRSSDEGQYSAGSPSHFNHLSSQLMIEPAHHRSQQMAMSEGFYHISSSITSGTVQFEISKDTGSNELVIHLGQELSVTGSLAQEPVFQLTVQNPKPFRATLTFETLGKIRTSTSAYSATAFPDFFDHFPEDVMHPSVNFQIHEAVFLSAALLNPIELLEEFGDLPVREIYKEAEALLSKCARTYEGRICHSGTFDFAITFPKQEMALKAGVEVLQLLRVRNMRNPHKPLRLRLGLYSGKVLVSSPNGKLNFFGSALALAQAVMAKSQGDDLVSSKKFFSSKEVVDFIRSERVAITTFDFELNRLKIPLYRVKLIPFA
ncbi:MAG: DUF5939 domain-containing protein [Chloroherpetonaceae bacterium]|nr:DUF5939 domain-containing protein [Chloroherpetonaceae bacterium]